MQSSRCVPRKYLSFLYFYTFLCKTGLFFLHGLCYTLDSCNHKEVFPMPGFLILILVFAVLAVAIVFISNQEGGWKGGCGGNCAACRHRCEEASDAHHTEDKS